MKTAVITGASRGIGRALAEAFWEAGYATALCCRKNIESLRAFAREKNACRPGSVLAFQTDVSDSEGVSAFARAAEEAFGRADVLINNAGVSQISLFTDITEEDWDRIFDTNVKGAFLVTKAFLPGMIHEKAGRIINISSMWGETGASCEVHYSASKGALIAMTKALAKELGPSGITVNCITPGVIDTEMNGALDPETILALKEETPLGVIGSPGDVARAALFLASPGAGFITGQVLGVNGGMVI